MGVFEDELRKAQQTGAQWRLSNAQNNVANAQSKIDNSNRGLGGMLSDLASGLTSGAKSLWNAGAGAVNAVAGGIQQANQKADRDRLMNEMQEKRNDVARKYGYKSYSDALNDENASAEYFKDLQKVNAEATDKTNALSDRFKNSAVSKNLEGMSQNKYGADAIRGESFLADILTAGKGGAAVNAGINVAQGAIGGIADQLENTQDGESFDWDKAGKLATSGAIGAGVGSAVSGGLGKLGNSNNSLARLLSNNVVNGALTGAASAGAQTAALGGDISDILNSAGAGFKMGGVSAGITGLGRKGFNAISDKINGENTIGNTRSALDTMDSRKATSGVDVESDAPQLDNATRAKLEREVSVNKQKQGAALASQYGTIDAPTGRAVGDPEKVLVDLYDNWGLKTPADVQFAGKYVTGKDGLVTKMTRELASSSKGVNANIDSSFVEDIINNTGLEETKAKALRKQIQAAINRTNGDTLTDGNTVLDTIKQLQDESADYLGKGGTYHRPTSEDKRSARALNLVADELQGRLWDSADDISNIVTPERINALKNLYPDNNTFANAIEDRIASATNGAELRAAMKPLVDGSKIAQNSKQNSMGVGNSISQAFKTATSANPAVAGFQALGGAIANSNLAKNIDIEQSAKKAKNAQAILNGEKPAKSSLLSGLGDIPSNIKNGTRGLANRIDNLAVNTNNIADSSLGNGLNSILMGAQQNAIREGAQTAGANYLVDAQNALELENAQKELQDAQSNPYLNVQESAPQTGNSTNMLDTLSVAMESALASGDIDSYGKLASLYKQAADIYEMQNQSASNGLGNLSSTQLAEVNKIDNASNAIDELESLYAKAGGGKGVLGGNGANFMASIGLNNDVAAYNSMSKGLINQIMAAVGKTDSLNNEGEVQRALDLIPQITDTQEVANAKLESLRRMLGNTKQTLYTNYGIQ